MQIKEIENGIILENVAHFNATHIFECGQCFRWHREEDGSYTGVAFEKVLNVRSELIEGGCDTSRVTLRNTCLDDFYQIWYHYFDFSRDYGAIKNNLSQDPILKTAIDFGYGMRILNQDPWEMLISFIISANNNIPRISKCIQRLSEAFGSECYLDGKCYYSFPTLEALYNSGLQGISLCRAGFRCKYIYDTVVKIYNKEVDLFALRGIPSTLARKELMRLNGVGPKVADCILLFSMQRYEVYPLDVWVKRVTEYYYFQREVNFHKKVKMDEIQRFAGTRFGELAGFAQQYLFYYARENKIL